MPGEISSPLLCHGTVSSAKPAAPLSPLRVKEGADPVPSTPQMFVKTSTDLALQVGGTIQRQLLQGVRTLQGTLPSCLERSLLQAALDIFWRNLVSSSQTGPQRATSD